MYTVYLTTECNYKCNYCYENYDNHIDVDLKKLINIIDFIFIYDKKKQIQIGFMGGEPLLKKKLIYEAISYIEKHYFDRDVKYYITTNCSLIDNDFLFFIQKHKFNIRLSFDGNKRAQNRNRTSKAGINNYENILKNIYKIRDHDIQYTIRMTVAENTIDLLYENIKFLHNNGLNNICMIMDINMNIEGNAKVLTNQYSKIVDYYISEHKAGRPFSIDQFDGKFLSFMRDACGCFTMCGAGVESFSIMPDGNIYPCAYLTNNPNYCIGSIDSNINKFYNKEISANLFHRTNMKCKNCEIIGFCHGMKCGYMNYLKTGYINIPSELTCNHEKIAYSATKKILYELKEDSNMFKEKLTPYFNYMELNNIHLNDIGKMLKNYLIFGEL